MINSYENVLIVTASLHHHINHIIHIHHIRGLYKYFYSHTDDLIYISDVFPRFKETINLWLTLQLDRLLDNRRFIMKGKFTFL
jgi:hypothetical protein